MRFRNSTAPHTLPRHSCCTRQGHLHLFIEQQHYSGPRALNPLPVPCDGSLGPPRGPGSVEQALGGWRVSTSFPGKLQGCFISAREPVWARWRLGADGGVSSEPLVSSPQGGRKVGPQSPWAGSLPPSTHLSLCPLGGRVWGASELEWVTLHCVHDHIAHVGN